MKRLFFTLMIFVFCLTQLYPQGVRCKVFLQGAYTSGPLMSPSLNVLIPFLQPFNTNPWNFPGNEMLNTIPSDMVDWVLVELRDAGDTSLIISRRAALLLENADIVETNLATSVSFVGLTPGNYYICIYHRNHIPVMSANPITLPNAIPYDFSDTLNFPPYGGGSHALVEIDPGKFGLIAGDVNKDGVLKYSGPGNDR